MSQPMNRATILNMVYTMQAEAVANAYAALAAENANLKALQWETLKERNKAEAENERLRKAGDAMAEQMQGEENGVWKSIGTGGPAPIRLHVRNWNAAKEGRDAR